MGPKGGVHELDLLSLASDHVLAGKADVLTAREARRHKRVVRTLLVVALVECYFGYRVFTHTSIVGFPGMSPLLGKYGIVILLICGMGLLVAGPFIFGGRSPHSTHRASDIDVRLSDVRGAGSVMTEVVRSINLFLAHQTFPRHGWLGSARRPLRGSARTGKTFVAKAMAKEANVPFLFVSASAFQSMYYGQTNRKIRSFFKQLRKHAHKEGGAIGFIEEIDAIGGHPQGHGWQRRDRGVSGVVNELLVQLQSFDTPTRGQRVAWAWIDLLNRYLPDGSKLRKPAVVPANVLVVGATNRKDDLDPALIRPGRFDRSIYFGLPGRRARADIIAYYLGKKAHAADLDEHGAVDVVAGMTFGTRRPRWSG